MQKSRFIGIMKYILQKHPEWIEDKRLLEQPITADSPILKDIHKDNIYLDMEVYLVCRLLYIYSNNIIYSSLKDNNFLDSTMSPYHRDEYIKMWKQFSSIVKIDLPKIIIQDNCLYGVINFKDSKLILDNVNKIECDFIDSISSKNIKQLEVNSTVSSLNCLNEFEALETINIKSMNELRTLDFYNLNNLKELNINGNLKTLGMFSISNCPNLTKVTLKGDVVDIMVDFIGGHTPIKQLTLDMNDLSYLNQNAFRRLKELEVLNISKSLTSCYKAFENALKPYVPNCKINII